MEDASGIPEELRCKRSDGKQWRCSALSMPDKTVCEKHYIQAKRRAANSAMRASEKKARRKQLAAAGSDPLNDAYLGTPGRGGDDRDASVSPADGGVGSSGGGGEFSGGTSPAKKHKGRKCKGRGLDRVGVKGSVSPLGRHWEGAQRDTLNDGRVRSAYAASQDYSGRSTDSSGEVEGLTCHQCQRNDKAVIWCMSCSKRGYCESCIFRRYPNISIEDIRRVCPACHGICNCRVCLFGDNLIKGRIREMASIDKLRQLHRLLSFLLPVLKQIHSEQCYELELEIRAYGMKSDIPRAKLHPDEQMCCDSCKIPILDYHRHCMNCLYDLCLGCCRDLRRASSLSSKGESEECQTVDQDQCGEQLLSEHPEMRRYHYSQKHFIDEYAVDFTSLFPKWKVNSDNSISCPPSEHGACGKSPLILRRILKINWVAKLVKNAEEMVNGCKTSDFRSASCIDCAGNNGPQSSHSTSLRLYKASKGEGSNDNFLYSPTLQDIEQDNIGHFHKHWVNGEPVVIRHVFEPSLSACWDPMSIWRGIQEITDDEANDDMVVRVMNCFDQSEAQVKGLRCGMES